MNSGDNRRHGGHTVQHLAPAAHHLSNSHGCFQITATPRPGGIRPTVWYEFWFSDAQITDIYQVENAARYLGTALYWIAASGISGARQGFTIFISGGKSGR
ncbi:hypothetical protein KCP75_09335 [Salmonella enterica subsp. enterica]|nr:hypothetical protein KCP75_09335 [Salmonella enterica subsp. enterica]